MRTYLCTTADSIGTLKRKVLEHYSSVCAAREVSYWLIFFCIFRPGSWRAIRRPRGCVHIPRVGTRDFTDVLSAHHRPGFPQRHWQPAGIRGITVCQPGWPRQQRLPRRGGRGIRQRCYRNSPSSASSQDNSTGALIYSLCVTKLQL